MDGMYSASISGNIGPYYCYIILYVLGLPLRFPLYNLFVIMYMLHTCFSVSVVRTSRNWSNARKMIFPWLCCRIKSQLRSVASWCYQNLRFQTR